MNPPLPPNNGMTRRNFLGLGAGVVFSAVSGTLLGCSPGHPLRVGVHVWPGYEFMYLAQQLGWVDPADTRLVRTVTASESIKAITDGRLDGAALTLDEVLRARADGLPLQVVLVFDISDGADALLAQPGIASLDALRGKRIAMEMNVTSEILLTGALQSSHLKHSDVTLLPIVGEHAKVWREQHPDAIITYEPTASRLEKDGAVRLFDSRQTPNKIIDVLAFLPESLERHGVAVEALIQAHLRCQHLWRINRTDTSYRMARHLGVEGDEVPRLFQHLLLPDLDYNRHLLSAPATELNKTAHELCALLAIPEPKSAAVAAAPLFLANHLPEKF